MIRGQRRQTRVGWTVRPAADVLVGDPKGDIRLCRPDRTASDRVDTPSLRKDYGRPQLKQGSVIGNSQVYNGMPNGRSSISTT
jgi:hypothetical protein